MARESRSAFFYGTLMAPKVLHRVCHGSSSPHSATFQNHTLKTYPAILHNYRRHRVKYADYPAVLPSNGSTVRGTYVTGLTDADIWRLDIFEGDEYQREMVKPHFLTTVGDESGDGNVEGDEVEAETYIWIAGRDKLEEDEEWDFAEFRREKMRYWVGVEAEGEYAEVDEAVAAQSDGTGGRGANGHISRALKKEQDKDDVLKNAVRDLHDAW